MYKKLEEFKRKFMEKYPRWVLLYNGELPDEELQKNAVYFIITGEKREKKQKTVDFSIYFFKSKSRNDLLEFRKEVIKFIEFITENFNSYDFKCLDNSFEIAYSTEDTQLNMRSAEIRCSYDFTLYQEEVEKFSNMENLEITGGME